MIYLGFGVGCFIYLTLFVLYMLYLGNAIFKKYRFANNILPLIFLHSLFTILILAWALIVMNEGFSFEFNQNMDFTMLSIFFIFLFIITEFIDYKVRKNIIFENSKPSKIYRFILPALTVCLFFLATIVFYFSCHYLLYLITW